MIFAKVLIVFPRLTYIGIPRGDEMLLGRKINGGKEMVANKFVFTKASLDEIAIPDVGKRNRVRFPMGWRWVLVPS
jgi:hypothetical protein